MSPESREVRYELARSRARGLLTLIRQKPPVDVQAIIELAGIPVVERVLIDGMRGTIGDVAGLRSIILNRHHRFSSEQERRWVLAEELAPGKPTMGLLEERRVFYSGTSSWATNSWRAHEREARAFAAELPMPFRELRKRWFAISQEHPVEGELSTEGRAERLATEFGVTAAAMRVRFQQMRLIPA